MGRDGKWVPLGGLSVPNGLTAGVMARERFDALCVDPPHGLSELKDVWPMPLSQTDTVPVVRVPCNDRSS